MFRKILESKKEAVIFLNKTLNLKKQIREEEIEQYNSSFINMRFHNQEADIIYKMKDRSIFFLIEHQTKIDYSMPYRIFQYENEIIREAIEENKVGNKTYKYPKVISIVLYSGRKKWDAKTYIKDMQEELETYEEVEFTRYRVVDVNDFSKEELLKEKTMLSKAMLIEKVKDTKELAKYLDKIVDKVNENDINYSKSQKELLILTIGLVLREKLEDSIIKRLIKKLKGEKENMLAVVEMIREENKRIFRDGEKHGEKRGERRGEKRAKVETAQKMLENGIKLDMVMKITGLTEKEIYSKNKKRS